MSPSISLLEVNLEKLTTDEIFSIAQNSLEKIAPSLRKKPTKLKAELLNQARSDFKVLKKAVLESQNVLHKIFEMYEVLKVLDRTKLSKVKEAIGMSTAGQTSKPNLMKHIVNEAKRKGFDIAELQNIIHSIGHPTKVNETMDIDENPLPLETTSTMVVEEMGASSLAPEEVNRSTQSNQDFSKEQMLQILDGFHIEQIKRVLVSLKIKASEKTLKRPKDMKDKIKKAIEKDDSLLGVCEEMCHEIMEKNSHFDSLATTFSHLELQDVSTFLNMDVNLHMNRAQLSNKIKNHLITEDISVPELIQKLGERNQATLRILDHLKTLSRPDLIKLKSELGVESKTNKSSEDLCSHIMKLIRNKDITTNDINLIVSRTNQEKELLKLYLQWDLKPFDHEILLKLLNHISPGHENDYSSKTLDELKDKIFDNVKLEENKLKFAAYFFDYNDFMMSFYLNSLSEMDINGLNQMAKDLDLKLLDMKDWHEPLQIEILIFKIMEHFRNKSFQDFLNHAKLDNYSFSFKGYISQPFRPRLPEWATIKLNQVYSNHQELLEMGYYQGK